LRDHRYIKFGVLVGVVLVCVLVAVSSTYAGYTYVIEDGNNFGDLSLNDDESLLMIGGEGHHLTLNDYCTARIEGTEPLLSEHNGGIWFLRIGTYNELEILGGDIHELVIGSDASAFIAGGRIDQIWSQQHVRNNPHITIDCKDWLYAEDTNKVSGTWFDDTTFDIQLIDVDGFSPAIDNIRFIPEPVSLLLMGAGLIFARKRRG